MANWLGKMRSKSFRGLDGLYQVCAAGWDVDIDSWTIT